MPPLLQQIHHLGIGRLTEIAVVQPDCVERLRRRQTDNFVGQSLDQLQAFRGRDWDGGDQPSDVHLLHGFQRGAERGARRDAVVDNDRGSAGDMHKRASAAIELAAPFDLFGLTRGLLIHMPHEALRHAFV
ncbi:MAG TPA: hypothetical protein VFO00_13405 [Vitreimonas sp.]|nr:hypothetical protein [Vitreimonas sp.]